MRGNLRIFKGLGFLCLLSMLLSPAASSQGSAILTNETANEGDITSPNAKIMGSGDPNPGVLPPNSRPGGLTYGEWNARWWQWAYSMPTDNHPLFDTAECGQGQSGNVWFLGSTFATEQGPSGENIAVVKRNCTIPHGKMIFFPVLNVEASTLEGNGAIESELRANSSWMMDHAENISAKIDGKPVKDLWNYNASSPEFTFGPLPENNVLQFLNFTAPGGSTSLSVADGIYLMLAPLSPGEHTIHFNGTFRFTNETDGFDFVFRQDVDYTITVKPNWRPPRMFMARI